MPTVIDSLVLELGLDPSRFTQGQRDALNSLRQMQQESTAGGKAIEEQTKRIGNVLTSFRREAVEALAIFLGGRGLKEFVGYVTNLDASVGRLGKTISMSSEDVSTWQGAIKQAGGTAEETNASLAGLSGEMNKFMLTGQSGMLPVLSRLGISLFDANRNLKTSGQLWLNIAEAIQGMDAAKATSFLQMIPGATQSMINFALLGPAKMREYLEVSRQAGVTTKEASDKAQEYQRSLAKLDQSATSFGRTLVNTLTPALVTVMDKMQDWLSGIQKAPEEAEKSFSETRKRMDKVFGDAGDSTFSKNLRKLYMRASLGNEEYNRLVTSGEFDKKYDEMFGARSSAPTAAPTPTPAPAGESRTPSTVPQVSEMESYIRVAAVRRGIDPDVAVRVAKSEGLYAYRYSPTGQSFVPGEQSFGPMQLNYSRKGTSLGDRFTKETGLDARDPSTWRQQVDFSLDQARRGGWGDWHGWKGAPFDGIAPGASAAARDGSPGPSTSSSTSTVSIGTVMVNAPQAKDAGGIAREIGPALQREVTAGAANSGPQ